MSDLTGPANAEPAEPAPTAAEAQFPYTGTQGLRPEPPAPPPPVRSRRRPGPRRFRWWPVLLGVTAALVGVAVVVVSLVWGPRMNPIAPVPGADAPPAGTAVTAYLDALAAGKAEDALRLGSVRPGNAELLTDQVLRASPASIGEVSVPATSNQPASQQVTASYRIGAEQVTTSFPVFRDGETWRLGQVVADADLRELDFAGLPITVNGFVVENPQVSLLPGQYRVGTTDPRYRVEHPDFLVRMPAVAPDLAAVRLGLSDRATREIAETATARLDACLSTRDLAPAGCGFRITHPSGVKLDERTLRWELRSGRESLTTLQPVLDQVGSATAPVSLKIHGEVRGKDGSLWEANAVLTRVYADLTQDAVTVEFG
ncbi:MAG: hypothetical protein VB036_08505 [Propionicimonas sp.]|nr:hypothetical protein [Propionicimonas sp.]